MLTYNHLDVQIRRIVAYCQANDWAGYDPYDAVNSRFFALLPFLNSRLPRLVLTQALKRSPINIRRLLLVPKTQNPKAIALFLSAFLKLSRIGALKSRDLVEEMIERLIVLRSEGIPYWCWGYSFPWQTRTIVVPKGAPNLVCTTFVGNALVDAYEQHQDARCLRMAASTAEYILDELYWTDGKSIAGFSYPLPHLRNQVPNANFLGAAFLCRVHKHTGEQKFIAPALRVARYAAAKQHADGSWDFYRAHFFREDGAPRYFHNRAYPVDIHCAAQSIITLLALKNLDPSNIELARSVFQWAMNHMWDERGFFYYRALRFCTIRTSYMRWAQAWMLLAMSQIASSILELECGSKAHLQTATALSRRELHSFLMRS